MAVEKNNDPALKARLITKKDSGSGAANGDTTEGSTRCRGIYVGGAGHLNLILADDSAPVLFSNVPAGTVLPFEVKRVMETSTTATLIVALY